jgi:polar amino acid transport system ATP-binding protein
VPTKSSKTSTWRSKPAKSITSAPDPELVNEVLAVVCELAKEGMTLMMVTHEMRFAREVCDRVVFMHLGRVHEIGPPEEVFTLPRTPELKQFLEMVE